MKILVLTPGVFDKGGISRYGRFQIRALREAFGADAVQVASLVGRRPDDLEEPLFVDWCGPLPVTRVSRAYFSAAAVRRALDFRPHVVLCGLVNFGPAAWVAARTAGARLVQNLYGLEIWSHLRWHRRAALRAADAVIADCHNSADQALARGLVRARPTVIWDCVDLARYGAGAPAATALARYGLEPRRGRLRILFVGRLARNARYKGPARLLRLIADLPGDRFEAVIAGKGDDVETLRGLATELGLGDRARIPGAIDENDLPDVYRSADAFYLASEVGPDQGEGIPLTPLEALACGVPVIVGDQDGSREILDGAAGLCCDPLDLPRQRAYLRRLADEPAFHDAERRAARTRAEAAFGFPAFAEKTAAALRAAAR